MTKASPPSSRQSIANEALDKIGKVLRARGSTLKQLIESGRKEREYILSESPEELS
jgi:hypothetical protein